MAPKKLQRRVHLVNGDLAKPMFGLTREEFVALAHRMDAIYHNGAWVSFVLPYQTLKPTNVLGTEEVLRLACEGPIKPVHYVSSLAVCSLTGGADRVVRENDDINGVTHVLGGYAQSKWVAEGLVSIAKSRGVPVAVYRPGMISGHGGTGAWNSGDFMSAILKGCVELGAAPALDTSIELTPVDYVSAAIVRISQQADACGKVFHLSNPSVISCRKLIEWISSGGYGLQEVSFDEWLARLEALGGELKNSALYPFVALLSELSSELREQTGIALGDMRLPRYDCSNTLQALSGTSIVCPTLNEGLLARYLSYFVKKQLIRSVVGIR